MDGPERGRVIEHCAAFTLRQCSFKVSEAGRQRVLRTRQRLVHAWVEGYAVRPLSRPPRQAVPFTYNPYRCGTFTRRNSRKPILTASFAWFLGPQTWFV
jgi:hypothetical protein